MGLAAGDRVQVGALGSTSWATALGADEGVDETTLAGFSEGD